MDMIKGKEHFKPVKLLSKDSFYKNGFEHTVKDLQGCYSNSMFVLDDGVRFLYFFDVTKYQNIRADFNDKEMFVESLKACVNRNLPPEELIYILKQFLKGRYYNVKLSFNQRRVLRSLVYGASTEVAIRTLGVRYKTWHNYKDAALKKLGIKNTLCYLRAANEWSSHSLTFD